MMRIFIFVLLIITPFQYAFASASVADRLRFKIDEGYAEIKAGSIWWKPILIKTDAKIEVFVDVLNAQYDDLSVFICDDQQLQIFKAGQPARCYGANRLRNSFSIMGAVTNTRPHYLVFSNTFSMLITKKAAYEIYADISTPWQTVHEFEEGMSKGILEIAETYGIDEFDITLKSCGHENAYSSKATGNITLCSELFFEFMRTNRQGAVEAVLLHEIGHTLLNKLGLPNWDNEETVDEFALYFLYLAGRQESAISWIDWYEQKNTRSELINAAQNDVRHPLSIQRARNIRRLLNNPDEMIARWNRLLYPYMTDEALQGILRDAPARSSPELAKEILIRR
ncbi:MULTISPECIES: DUF4344 domain-containing metallopeptidase [Thalassospira]|mgnify:CR=1 FL=1|uniref:DUF4344 domain-containing metallopeptidase n=1 Tax=Thalassospira TaxID=168934 RepID=UPI00091D6EE4|nr:MULTISPECIES: DUF4344 domain-containing metallopeptidase [Thalassospira]MAB34259.1 hypothetical protein [Thalassospira sp.]MBA05206.1 hypothetical protein [Thalassospira sp.]MDM7978669.1 DUF4344 domain-containing metallopeptidase [Thalassospira xiamenensis]OHZ01590.1 hypothetical protein BC440_17650 [Thalassospira sp. MIT1004]HBS22374.1 hypothetical protein [Thalassospira sp.]|tara:strand:+ start:158 stop:1174 length:1017 start_codon:yes stop_codon:yes gene_type:complete